MPSAKSKLPTVVITGANGFLGSALVSHFSKKGWSVRALVRDPNKYTPSKHVAYLAYDLSKEFNHAQIFTNATYLIHAAYVKYTASNTNAMTTNIEGSKRLIAACKEYKIKQAVFISSMSAHDSATSVYGRQKLVIEEFFLKTGGTVLRCGLIIGKGGILEEMSRFMQSWHIVPLIAGGKQPLQIVAISDLVKIIEIVLVKQQHGRYVIATPTIYSYRQFYKELARARCLRVVFIPIPYGVLFGLFKVASILHVPLGVGEDNLRGLQQLRSMESTADLSTIGVSLMNLEAALQESART